jgi:hypothetical protein
MVQCSMPSSIRMAVLVAALCMPFAPRAADDAAEGARLRERYEALKPELQHNAFGRPVHLASEEKAQVMRGDVHAVLDRPYAQVREALATRESWCALLVLPFNVKGCELQGSDGLSLFIGRTWDTPVGKATRIDFRFAATTADASALHLQLDAPTGPLGTRDYHIVFAAVPLDAGHTFVHLSYGYAYGALSKWAMQAYLATSGASKVGFSKDDAGHFVGGMRGVLERNTMRYFLAIDAYLATVGQPADVREARRMGAWFDAAERYPRQLHEMSRPEYLAYKPQDFVPPRERVAAR